MAYAQTNYSQLQGKTVNGVRPRYSIHDIGCFITSFCNLMERYGRQIAPDQLDNELAARNLYVDVDDGVYDDVGWSTICAYDPSIAITETGSGAPSSTDSIVKFVYRSTRTGNWTTHFCLVADAGQGLIIDSWDGAIKSWNGYGGPAAYASYTHLVPEPVTPPPAPEPTPEPVPEPVPEPTPVPTPVPEEPPVITPPVKPDVPPAEPTPEPTPTGATLWDAVWDVIQKVITFLKGYKK